VLLGFAGGWGLCLGLWGGGGGVGGGGGGFFFFWGIVFVWLVLVLASEQEEGGYGSCGSWPSGGEKETTSKGAKVFPNKGPQGCLINQSKQKRACHFQERGSGQQQGGKEKAMEEKGEIR